MGMAAGMAAVKVPRWLKPTTWSKSTAIAAALLALLTAGTTTAAAQNVTAGLTANPSTISAGRNSVLAFASTYAASCSINNGVGSISDRMPNGRVNVSPTATTIYVLTCEGPNGPATASATVTVAPPPTVTLTPSPNPPNINAGTGASVTLSWSAQNTTGCTLEPGGATTSPQTVAPAATTTYSVKCAGQVRPDAVGTQTVSVAWAGLSAEPKTVAPPNNTTRLTWNSRNAQNCSISNGVGSVPVNGTKETIVGQDTTFTLTCDGYGAQQVTSSAAVSVGQGVTASITASPSQINIGTKSTLTWESTNASLCQITANGGTPQAVATSNSTGYDVTPAATTIYSISCAGVGGTAAQSATVTVAAVSLTANPSTITQQQGGTSTLSWTSANVSGSTCTLNPGGTSVSTAGSLTVSPDGIVTYTISCPGYNSTGVTSSVTVSAPPVVTISTQPSPAQINNNQQASTDNAATISWSAPQAASTKNPCNWNSPAGTALAASGSKTVNPTATTTYSVYCTGQSGLVGKNSVAVTVASISLTATPPNITTQGGTSTLNWTASNAANCSLITGGSTPGSPVATTGNAIVGPAQSTTYTLSCQGYASATVSQTITVGVAPAVTVSVSPTGINIGSLSTLAWSTYGASSCSINQGIGSVGLSGTKTVSPTAATTYTVTCANSATPSVTGTGSATLQVAFVNLTISPLDVDPGGSATATWTGANISNCVLTPGNLTASGSTVKPGATTTYTVTCAGFGGNVTSTATLGINPVISSFTNSLANTCWDWKGGMNQPNPTLSWATTGANGCSLYLSYQYGKTPAQSVAANATNYSPPSSITKYYFSCATNTFNLTCTAPTVNGNTPQSSATTSFYFGNSGPGVYCPCQ